MPHTAESIFERAFLPLYPEDARSDLARARATDVNPAKNRAIFTHLRDAADVFVSMHEGVFGRSLALDYSDASVHRLSAAITKEARDAWMASGTGAESLVFNVVVHGAAYVGECVVRGRGGTWSARRPLWESVVTLSSPLGDAELAVFHWWLKSLADDALEGRAPTLEGRYRTHVENAFPPARSRLIAEADRALPRIGKSVRYDVFYKYLKAHLPELRDVGRDFPSPERFDAYAFCWLDFRLLDDGHTLLVFGAGAGGLHAFWLTADGFVKAALFSSDDEPTLEVDGDRLRVTVSVGGKTAVREVMWWGP